MDSACIIMELEEAIEIRQLLATYLNDNSSIDNDKVVSVLEGLKDVTVTKSLLEKSKLGFEVNKLRKSSGKQVSELSTFILLKWRDVMLEKPSFTKRPINNESSPSPLPVLTKEESQDGTIENSRKGSSPELKITQSNSDVKQGRKDSFTTVPISFKDMLQQYLTGDSVRDKCFEMLITALSTHNDNNNNNNHDGDDTPTEPDELMLSICRSIEDALYLEFDKKVDQPYKAKFRSKYLNLKDKQNATLRSALLSGVISPARFVAMTPAEMASDERRRQDQLLVEQNLRESKAAQDNEAETDQFKCGRCKQRRTKYYQLQTRSADEPMTTFVTCINCGNRWKFC